jgi:hypothetical protein
LLGSLALLVPAAEAFPAAVVPELLTDPLLIYPLQRRITCAIWSELRWSNHCQPIDLFIQ